MGKCCIIITANNIANAITITDRSSSGVYRNSNVHDTLQYTPKEMPFAIYVLTIQSLL